MPNYQKTILIGHLCRDNDMKYAQSGMAILKNAIAVTKKSKDKEKTMFLDITVFGKTAETMNTYTKKGSAVLVEGELELEQWEKDGVKRSKHSLNVNTVQFMDSRGGKRDSDPEPMGVDERRTPRQTSADMDSIPFARFEPWPE